MKLLVELELEKESIDIDFRRVFISFLKKILSETNGGLYFEEYYSPSNQKPFTFSVIFNKPIFSKELIEVTGKSLRLVLSTADSRTGFILFSGITNQKGKKFSMPLGNCMTVVNVAQQNEQEVHGSKILIKMLAPLCIRKHDAETNKDWYYSPQQEDFICESKRVIKDQLMAAGFSEALSEINIIPVDTKLVIVKFYGINVESTLGDFILEGDKASLNYLLRAGIGSRKSSGFGMAKLLAEE